MTLSEALQWADKNCQPEAVERLRSRAAVATLAAEVRRLRVCLREHAKWADKAAMVVATIEAENDDESEQLHAIVEGLSTWIPAEIMGTNA